MFCPKCGTQVAEGAAFCPNCGHGFIAAQSQPMQAPSQTGPAHPAEASGLNKVMWAGIIQLVAIVVGWVIAFYVFSNLLTTVSNLNLPPNPTPAQVSTALGPLFQDFSLILPVIILLGLASLVALTLGFRDLKNADRRFSTPYIFMIVMLTGGLLSATGAVLLFNGIPDIIANIPTNSTGGSAALFNSISSLVTALAAFGLGGLLALIGGIGGEILGLWRVGSRYDETLLKIGAIFTIIPLLNIVAPILVLIGAYQAKGRLGMPH